MQKPRWINRLFYGSVVALLVVVCLTLYSGLSSYPYHADEPVPDLSINLGSGPVREHCTYCHPEGSRPAPDLSRRAIAEHPDIGSHQWEKLGCTGCHLGEGMALDVKISHGLPGLGARQVLIGRDLQASCFQCHSVGPLNGANKAWKGYQRFLAKGCNTCHHIAGLGQGGRYGPDLSHIGSLLGLDLLQQAIRDPKADLPNSIMPRFPLSKGQAREIAYFLKSRIKQPFYATLMQIQAGQVELPVVKLAPEGPLDAGERLLFEKQCLACHRFRGTNGRIAPDLSFIGSLRSRGYLENFLANPVSLVPGAIMPQVAMSAEEKNLLLDFLYQQAVAPVDLSRQLAKKMGQEEPAKQLFMRLCQDCHAAEGNGRGPLQPNLANFPRAFAGNVDFFRQAEPERLLTSIAKGVPGTSMPGYEKILSAPQREELLHLIFSAFVGIRAEDKATREALPPLPPVVAPGVSIDRLFAKRCAGCHGARGNGKGADGQALLPRPRNLTNQPYFAALSDQRIARAIYSGVPGTAMPAHADQLDAAQLWGLVRKIRQLPGGNDGN